MFPDLLWGGVQVGRSDVRKDRLLNLMQMGQFAAPVAILDIRVHDGPTGLDL